jgi:hypothetical protein
MTPQLQTGAGTASTGGLQDDFQFFTKAGEREVYNKRFALTARRMAFTFKPVAGTEQPLQWLKVISTQMFICNQLHQFSHFREPLVNS